MKKFFLKVIILCIIIGLIATGFITIITITVYPKLPSMADLRNYHPKLPLQIYSEDNVLLGQFGDEHRIFINADETPLTLIKAILAAEDTRFYEHGGVDVKGIIRALLGDIISGKLQSGASTITMQVARNFFLTSKKTFSRKFYEILLAYKIEESLNKNQILELYINQIYLGQRAYGFAEASMTYFGKPLKKINIAEYAILAGLPKAPSAYNPIVNFKRATARKNYILGRMLDANFINQEQYDSAMNQKIKIMKNANTDAVSSGAYVAEMVRQMMYKQYGEAIYAKGYKVYTTVNNTMQKAAYNALRNGLLRYTDSNGYNNKNLTYISGIYSGIQEDELQEVINNAFDHLIDYGDISAAIVLEASQDGIIARIRNGNNIKINSSELKLINNLLPQNNKYNAVKSERSTNKIKQGAVIYVHNATDKLLKNKWVIVQIPSAEGSIIALNPNNGAIKALIGGFDFNKNSFNHAVQAMRQPGSGFKPFIYSAALEKGFNTNTMIDDSPVCYKDGTAVGSWCPKNDDGDGFSGSVTFRYALAKSLNIPTIKILNQITPEYAIDFITKFGFNKEQFHPYLTMALGANEVTPLQLATAYAVFANGGYLIKPYLITKITDSNNNIIASLNEENLQDKSQAIDPRNAYIMNSILQDAVHYGTGKRSYKELKRDDLAGKTGTTNDNKDVWFNGYFPNLVTIAWVGYDEPKSLGRHAYGASIAIPIWLDFIRNVINQIPMVTLLRPDGITVITNANGQNEYLYDKSINNESIINNNESIHDDVVQNQNHTQEIDANKDDTNKISNINADQSNSILDNQQQQILDLLP